MKHKHSGNFSNHKNLMYMSFQTYNTFFGNNLLLPIVLLELQIGERYFTFWKLALLLDAFAKQVMPYFFPSQQTQKQSHSKSKWPKRALLGTSPGAMISDFFGTNLDPQLLEIQVEKVTQSKYNNIYVHCHNQQSFKTTFWSVNSMLK